MKPLVNANISVLDQLEEFIQLLDDTSYNAIPTHTKSSIGKHVRHILDHFRAAKKGLPINEINYNERSRDSAEEVNLNIALLEIANLKQWFSDARFENKPLAVISEIQIYEQESKTFCSDLEREYLYLINHSIHHMAYAALLAKLQGINVPNHIGLAPSTASYERTLKESTHEEKCA